MGIESDVLVTSGSSFSAVAGVLRSDGITLAAIAKEGDLGLYDTSESLAIDACGNIQKIRVLERFMELRTTAAARGHYIDGASLRAPDPVFNSDNGSLSCNITAKEYLNRMDRNRGR